METPANCFFNTLPNSRFARRSSSRSKRLGSSLRSVKSPPITAFRKPIWQKFCNVSQAAA